MIGQRPLKLSLQRLQRCSRDTTNTTAFQACRRAGQTRHSAGQSRYHVAPWLRPALSHVPVKESAHVQMVRIKIAESKPDLAQFVVPRDGDTCTITLDGDFHEARVTYMGNLVVSYGFVEQCTHTTLPLRLNLTAAGYHDFRVSMVGSGSVDMQYTFHDMEERRMLSLLPPFRQDVRPFVLQHTPNIIQNDGKAHLPHFARVVDAGVHCRKTTGLESLCKD